MNDPLAASFARQIVELDTFLSSRWAWPSPEAGFGLFVFHAAKEKSSFPDPATLQWSEHGGLRHAHALSSYGFLMASGVTPNAAEIGMWAREFGHVAATEAFPLDRQSFAYRPLEVLGLALGASKCPGADQQSLDRFRGAIRRLPAEGNQDEWSKLLYRLSAGVVNASLADISVTLDAKLPMPTLCLLKWLHTVYPGEFPIGTASYADALDTAILERASAGKLDEADVGRAAVVTFGLQRAVSQRIRSRLRDSWPIGFETQDALSIVESICRRFPLFARQVRIRRKDVQVTGQQEKEARPTIEMKDEYDVQDSLHAILKLHFDDVRKEEWSPSYAGGQTRMDFVLKKERIVIETKFMGAKLTQTEVAKQLAIDEKFYRQHPDCGTLVCFVYDPDGRCTNPAALESDASTSDGTLRVLVVVAPKGV